MGLEQHTNAEAANVGTGKESPFQIQLLAEAQEKQQAARPQEVKPEGRGGPPAGGHPGGGGGERPPDRPPQRPPEQPPERPPTRPPDRPPEQPPERPPTRPPDRPPEQPPERPPTRPPDKPPEQPPEHPPGPHPPGPHPPGPHPPEQPPRPDPHPGDPHHGFNPGRPFEPPQGGQWGWQDQNRWNRGWDPFFFQQDPNFGVWQSNIDSEAQYVAGLLDSGNAVAAANELNQDMLQMGGDIYAQNQLLNQVSNFEGAGPGAAVLNLGEWNGTLGTWRDTTITPAPGDPTPVIPIEPFDSSGNPIF